MTATDIKTALQALQASVASLSSLASSIADTVAKINNSYSPNKTNDFVDTSKYRLTFAEEFDDPNVHFPNPTWKTQFYFWGHTLDGNKEAEWYCDEQYVGDGNVSKGVPLGVNPFRVKDSLLTIEAAPTSPYVKSALWGYPYTSGLLTTEPDGTAGRVGFSQKYGYFVARMKLPKGQGLWPAFWLMAADKSWPPEIDPLEAFGGPNANGEGGVTKIHSGRISADHSHDASGWFDVGIDLTADFHVYSVEWTPTVFNYRVDDKLVLSVPNDWDKNANDKPMYMLVNLAVGNDGSWPGKPTDPNIFPAHLVIDFVRAYAAI